MSDPIKKQTVAMPDEGVISLEGYSIKIGPHSLEIKEVDSQGLHLTAHPPETNWNNEQLKVYKSNKAIFSLNSTGLIKSHSGYIITVANEQLRSLIIRLKAQVVLCNHQKEMRANQIVPKRFKQVVYQMIDGLQSLRSLAYSMNHIYALEDKNDLKRAEDDIIYEFAEYLAVLFPPIFNALADSLQGVSANIQKSSVEYFRIKLQQVIFQGRDPRLVEEEVSSQTDIWPHRLFAKSFTVYRQNYLTDELKQQRLELLLYQFKKQFFKNELRRANIAFVGSDVVGEFFDNVMSRPEFSNIELNITVLEQSEFQLRKLNQKMATLSDTYQKNFALTFVNDLNEGAEKFDLIYFENDINFLGDSELVGIVSKVDTMLSDSGHLVLSAYTVSEATHLTMSLALNWDIIIRNNEDYKLLAAPIESKKLSVDRLSRSTALHLIFR